MHWFVMRADMAKRRIKLVTEGTTSWIYGEQKETLEKSWI